MRYKENLNTAPKKIIREKYRQRDTKNKNHNTNLNDDPKSNLLET